MLPRRSCLCHRSRMHRRAHSSNRKKGHVEQEQRERERGVVARGVASDRRFEGVGANGPYKTSIIKTDPNTFGVRTNAPFTSCLSLSRRWSACVSLRLTWSIMRLHNVMSFLQHLLLASPRAPHSSDSLSFLLLFSECLQHKDQTKHHRNRQPHW